MFHTFFYFSWLFCVKVAETGVTGTFRSETLNEWLQKHNPSQLEFKRAVSNLTKSLFIHSLILLVILSFIFLFIHSFIPSQLEFDRAVSNLTQVMYSFFYSSCHSFIHSFILLCILSFIHSFIHPFFPSQLEFNRAISNLTKSCIYSFIHLLHLFIHLFSNSLIQNTYLL